jgi:hypothetical protein
MNDQTKRLRFFNLPERRQDEPTWPQIIEAKLTAEQFQQFVASEDQVLVEAWENLDEAA